MKKPKLSFADELGLINRARLSVPVDVKALAGQLGLSIRETFMPDDVSGMIVRLKPDQYEIVVNASHSHTRRRFTLAHELGHFVLHRHLLGDGIDEDRAYRSKKDGKYRNLNIGPIEETEANRFAADLLMPYEHVQAQRKETRDDVRVLADRFGVSPEAMSIRMGLPREQAAAR